MKKLVLVLVGLLLLPVTAFADTTEAPGLKVSPVSITQNATAGQTTKVQIILQNTGSVSVTENVLINDFTASDNKGNQPKLQLDSTQPASKYSLASWLTSPKSVTLKAGETITYDATFAVPKDAAARSYFGALRFAPTSTNSGQTSSVGSLVFLTVGTPPAALTIDKIDYTEPNTDNSKGSFAVQVTNNGDGISDKNITLTITDSSGQVVQELQPDTQGVVLPSSTRIYTFTPTAVLPAQRMTVSAKISAPGGDPVKKDTILDKSPQQAAPTQTTQPKRQLPLVPIIGGAASLVLFILFVMVMKKIKKHPEPATASHEAPVTQQPRQTGEIFPAKAAPASVNPTRTQAVALPKPVQNSEPSRMLFGRPVIKPQRSAVTPSIPRPGFRSIPINDVSENPKPADVTLPTQAWPTTSSEPTNPPATSINVQFEDPSDTPPSPPKKPSSTIPGW